jgi:4-amino-4-deoxy-L-arabinose transferase-like glycosyltransferase
MLAILPLLNFLSLFLYLITIQRDVDWRRTFLRTCILWGLYAVLILELFSLISGISAFSLSIAWTLPTLLFSFKLFQGYLRSHCIKFPTLSIPKSWLDRVLILAIGATLILTLIVATKAPPQTGDSHVYHMSRVAHWSQNQSIRPFATGIRFQNTMSQAAELIILHFYVLAGSDQFANLPQWLAMAGSLIGVYLIASQLGLKLTGRLFTVAFTASIPMGIVQASNTMTDYVVSFWMICVVSEGLALIQDNPSWKNSTFLGLAVGLAIATKPTSFAFLLPFTVLIPIKLLRQIPFRRLLYISLWICFLILITNIGHLSRNYTLYGSPMGHEGTIQRHANESINGKVIISNLLRHASLHVGTCWPEFNDWVYLQITKVHVKLDQDINDPKTTFTEFRILTPNTHEDFVTNPIHAYLIIFSFFLNFIVWRRTNSIQKTYGAIVILGFIVFSSIFKYQIFATRLQLPFFVLMAPYVGSIFSKLPHRKLILCAGIVIILMAYPWLFKINSRPIFPNKQDYVIGSIFSESRENLYFASLQSQKDTYTTITDMIRDKDCSNIGLFLSGSSPEYLWWVLLGAPRKDLKIEWLVSDSPTAKYEDPSFSPCAILCENCPSEWTKVRGLPLAFEGAETRFILFITQEE